MICYERVNNYIHGVMNVLDKACSIQADISKPKALRSMASRVERHCERKLDNITVDDILAWERAQFRVLPA